MTSPVQLSLFSPAKINLFLHITGRRADGYHNLQTVFRLLDWGDTLHFKLSNGFFTPQQALDNQTLPLTLSTNVTVTTNIVDNLITKAAIALIQYAKDFAQPHDTHLPKRLPIVDITLNKVLPTGAGLGGGSSNAATTLLALNQLWGLNIDKQTLIKIGATVGADVPIFILGLDAIAEGIGEQLTPIQLPHQYYLLLNPDAHASTQQLFSHPSLSRDIKALTIDHIIASQDIYLNQLVDPYCNVFTPVVTEIVPEVADALDYLKQLQLIIGTQTTARMTGSGSSVFLPIPDALLTKVENYITHRHEPPCHSVITQSMPACTTP